MASSSSNMFVQEKSFKYDVFVSFRGEDTRENFVIHLYQALKQYGIETYTDDWTIKTGNKTIDDQLMKIIEDSRFHIILFSVNYASSSWCLNELVKIMGCREMTGHTALPVFYDVEPAEVRYLRGAFGEAFKKNADKEGAEKSKTALEEAASLAGWELNSTLDGQIAKIINQVVQKISLQIHSMNFVKSLKFTTETAEALQGGLAIRGMEVWRFIKSNLSGKERTRNSSSQNTRREDMLWLPPSFQEKLYRTLLNLYEKPLQEETEISMALEAQDKRWSLHDEMSKLFNASLDRCFPILKEEADLFTSYKKEHGDYNCQNVLTIWPNLRKNAELKKDHPHIIQPTDVGKAIMSNLPESAIDMIEGQPSVVDVGFVTFSLSPKWMAEHIHKMLQDGIDTWAPKLPVEMVFVKYPSLNEEIHTGRIRQEAITYALYYMLKYSKVDVSWSPTFEKDMPDSPLDILKRWFSVEERGGEDLVIGVEDKPPFILAKKDLNHLYNDLATLRDGFEKEKADWIVYVTPVRQQEYIEMCFTVAKLEKWTPTDRKWKWIPDGISYAGYGTCSTEPKEKLASFLNEVTIRCKSVAEGDAKMLGYTAIAVCNCVFRYTFLKTHRLANCRLTLAEMVGEEGNTFVYLLNTRAKIRRITDDLTKASKLIVEKNKRWGEGEECALELHLFEFIEAIKESCSYLSPHILCEYLYGLSKKFTNYYSSINKVGSVGKSTLLLCEAAAIVMDKCFLILGLIPMSFMMLTDYIYDWPHFQSNYINDVNHRDPPRNSRFELFSMRPYITTDPKFEKGKMFGFIAVSDKYGSVSDGMSHLFEPEFAYVPLFNHEWCDPINMHNGEYIYLGNPSTRNAVAFSSSIEISMEIYVTTEKNVFELCSSKFKLDLSNIWGKNLGNECRCIKVEGEDGFIEMHYMLIKDAVDAALEIRYKMKMGEAAGGCKVLGQIYAYYGCDILDHCRASVRPCYWVLLFRSDVPFALEGDKIPLRKLVLAVPKDAPLIISAYLYDIESEEVIMDDICELSSLTEGSSKGVIEGFDEKTRCSLSLKVDWTYQAQYL